MNAGTGKISSSLAPLRNILEHGRIGMLCRISERSRFAGALDHNWHAGLEQFLTPDERVVWQLFFRRCGLPLQAATHVLGEECIRLLQERCLLESDGAMVQSCGYALQPAQGFYVFAGFGKPAAGKRTEYVHLGFDSLAMGDLIQYFPSGSRALEVCAGSGILCLCLARRFSRVVGVDLCREVKDIAEVNIALAGMDERVELRLGSLFEPAAGERFDLIVANPPFSPNHYTSEEDPVGAGGPDGLNIARDIWRNAAPYLHPHGTLVMLLGMLGGEAKADFEDELQREAVFAGWHVELLDIERATAIDKLYVPRLTGEPIPDRIAQIRTAGAALGASHYHVSLICMRRDRPPALLRLAQVKGQPAMAAALREMRASRGHS